MLVRRILFLFFLLAFPFFQVKAASIDILEDVIWEDDQIIEGRVTVGRGAKLTINPGVQVEFREGGNLRIYGELFAEGEKNNPIVFFKKKRTPEGPNWIYYFLFGADSNSTIKNAVVKEAGGYSESGSWMPGLKVEGNLEIYDSLITQNYWAIQVRKEGTLKIRNSDIYDNYQTSGLEVLGNSAQADAIDNYWGDNSGPFHSSFNKTGKGGEIKGGNLQFVPWEERDKKPIILVPGFGESINLGKFIKEQTGEWWLFPFGKSIAALKRVFENSGYEENKNLFVSFYDWREPFRQSAINYLKPTIDLAKEKSGFKEVDIIAFSFGGLVSRGYIQENCFDFDVDKLITLGTPHRGVSKIYTFAEGGKIPADWSPLLYIYLWYKQISEDQNLLDYIQNYLPAIYEIMPTYDFLEVSGNLVDHQTMSFSNSSLISLNNEAECLKERVQPFFIGGTGFLTLDNIPIKSYSPNGNNLWLDGIPDPFPPVSESIEGDTTVLTKSSTWELEGVEKRVLESKHGSLPFESQQEIEDLLDINLTEPLFDLELNENYLIFCIASPIEIEIKNSEGLKLSQELIEIENSYFYENDPLGEKMILIYNPDIEYSVKIKGLASGTYKILTVLKEENEKIVSSELSGEINLGKDVDYRVDIIKEEDFETEIRIYEKIDSDYKIIIGQVINFYEEDFLKKWSVRQEILEFLLNSYNFSKKNETEKEKLEISRLKDKIGVFVAEDSIDFSKAQLLLESLDGF
jgi:hypothetical protein